MLSDRALARNVRLRSMVENYSGTVWRSLRRLGVPAAGADDGVQHVFLIASRRLDEIETGGERQYLLGITLRVASELRRTLRRRRELPLDADGVEFSRAAAIPPQQPDEMIDQKRLLELFATCFDKMPDKLREAFVLFELEELSASEVAQALRVPVGTVASRVRRARECIRKDLARRGIR
jgi:RNA polymerase sigma-70 factor (ECF subfamily)